MRSYRKTQVITIVALVIAIVTLGVGFAAFSTTLNISSSASVSPNSSDFNVGFYTGTTFNNDEAVVSTKMYNGAKQPSVIMTNGTERISNIGPYFFDKGEYVEYYFYIGNSGKYDAYLRGITFADVTSGSYKKCEVSGYATEALVQQACEGISVSISVDSNEMTSTTSLNNMVISPGEFMPVVVTVSYAEDAVLADGAFTVYFGDLVLDYSTVDNEIELISFTIGNEQYQAEKGMTWLEWSESQYFIFDGMVSESSVMVGGGDMVTYSNGEFVAGTDVIIDGEIYYREIGNYPT